jgi:hypothetical protein
MTYRREGDVSVLTCDWPECTAEERLPLEYYLTQEYGTREYFRRHFTKEGFDPEVDYGDGSSRCEDTDENYDQYLASLAADQERKHGEWGVRGMNRDFCLNHTPAALAYFRWLKLEDEIQEKIAEKREAFETWAALDRVVVVAEALGGDWRSL